MNQKTNELFDFNNLSQDELKWFYSIINNEQSKNKKLSDALTKHKEYKRNYALQSTHLIRT
ncbi:hypothetical protein AVENLUH13518_02173 [Acinetobacter venetianus]|uniref:Uncharacterized protein n=1 Tax=Acinetobacter venetianus TaxID=52133 RepID=A0A150HT04_9GAMM|nr:hypothetical protein AVENLUH13518_02173 [Acinetobacter venetianus]